MSGTCSFDGCTVDETGLCALSGDPLTCSNRVTNIVANEISEPSTNYNENEEVSLPSDLLGAPVLVEPEPSNAPVSSRSIGLEELNAMMGSRYFNVVGILGEPESGKTACLASLYLLVSHAMLEGWSFADSRSLVAFEEIARGARDWNDGVVPEQMTTHTELADEHRPGFLHLRLIRQADGRRIDLALPDVPGEWTQALITSARSDRLSFIKSADTIWIVLDGRTLADLEKRQGLIARVGQLAARLSTMLDGQIPRLLIVVTHRDLHIVNDIVADRLLRETLRRGANAEIVDVAPFSDQPDVVPAGFGITKLIDMTVGEPAARPPFWPSSEPREGSRAYLNYRRDR